MICIFKLVLNNIQHGFGNVIIVGKWERNVFLAKRGIMGLNYDETI